MGYTITVEVEPTEHPPRQVVKLAHKFGGTLDKTRWSVERFNSTVVEFDSWENFLKFADGLVGRVSSVKEETHPHWVATAGTPFWAHSVSDEAQLFSISPPHAAAEVAKFIRQALVKRALSSEDPYAAAGMAESVVRSLLDD